MTEDRSMLVKMAAMEMLIKTVALALIKSSNDPNMPIYLWNTFENSLDAQSNVVPDTNFEIRELIRMEGQAMLTSVIGAINS